MSKYFFIIVNFPDTKKSHGQAQADKDGLKIEIKSLLKEAEDILTEALKAA